MEKLFGRVVLFCLVIVITAHTVCTADLREGLVSHWPLDGDATDVVGGFHGEEVGNPNWVEGYLAQTVELDGQSHINIPDFNLITNTITFVAWINGWKAADWAGIVGSRTPSACEMIFGDNDLLHYVWNNNAENTWRWDGAPTIPQNEWAMTALTVDPDKATAYVYSEADGLQQGSNDIPHIEQTVGVLNIGWVDCCGGGRYFQGIIDEVMIYDRALNADELESLATGGLAIIAPDAILTATWGKLKAK